MKKIICNSLLVLGVIIISISIGSKVINKMSVNKSNRNLENRIQDIEENNIDLSKVYDDIKVGDEIGRFIIPALNITGVIKEGTADESIKHDIGHFENTAMPGKEGNFAVAGHSSTVYNNIFNFMEEIKLDDEIKIQALDGEYVYKVTDFFKVYPEDTSVLEGVLSTKEITIVTCTEGGKERFIVKGILK